MGGGGGGGAFTDRLFNTDHKQTLIYPEVGWGRGVSRGGADVYCMSSQIDYLIQITNSNISRGGVGEGRVEGRGVSRGGADVYCMSSQSDYLITDHKL